MTTELKHKFIFYLSIVAIIILFCFVEYSLVSKGFYALSADESGHTLEAYEWYQGESQLFSIWLPFAKVTTGTALKIHYDLIMTPRITSLVFGLLTFLSLIILSYQLYENKIIAILTGFFAAIFLSIAVFSVLPLIEIFFFFFVLSSISCFLLWIKRNKYIFLWLTVILTGLSTTTRYEAWVFSLFIFIMIIFQIFNSQKTGLHKRSTAIIAALIIFAFPLYWIYLSILASQSAQGFVFSVTSRYSEGNMFSEIKNNALYQFLIINVTSLNIIGLISLFHLTKINPNVKKYSFILFGTLITFSIISYIVKAMPTHNHWRVAMIWSLLLLPFTANWLYYLLDSAKTSPINKYGFIIFFILLIYFFSMQTTKYTTSSYLSIDDINIGKYLNEVVKEDVTKIYVMNDGSDKWRYSNFLVTSQKPDQFVTKLENFNYIFSDSIIIDQKLISEIVSRKIKIVLVPAKTIITNGTKYFSEIKTFDQWKVYEINPFKEE